MEAAHSHLHVVSPPPAHPPWVDEMHAYIKPYWNEILDGPWGEGVTHGRLTLEQMQGWLIQIYPFIHTFPKFLAETLIKVEDDFARAFYITNIRVEKAHADHWVWMGQGFGIKADDMLSLVSDPEPVLRDVQSLTDWLWYINAKGSLPEAIAATSFAIEGVTGDIARKVASGFEHYKGLPGVDLGPKTYRWMREHAEYDDDHPKIALDIIVQYATTPQLQKRCMLAARRSLQLLNSALLASMAEYSRPERRLAHNGHHA